MQFRAGWTSLLALSLGVGTAVLGACNSHPITYRPTTELTEQRDEVKQDEVIKTPIDLLFVVDNSGSMEEEQNNLTANFGQFIDLILQTPAEFRIAVISTDMSDANHSGRFLAKDGNPKILSRNTARLREAFTENAKIGTMGDGFEKGLDAIKAALSAPLIEGDNANFLRRDASLGIILLSDEEDCSHPPGAIPEFDGDECVRNIERMTKVKDYVDFLKALKGGDAGKVFFAAITGPDLLSATPPPMCTTNVECMSGRCADGKCCPPAPTLTECRTNDECVGVPGTSCYGRKCLPQSPLRRCALDGTCQMGAPHYAPRTCSCFQAGTGLTEPGTRYIDMVRSFGANGIYAPICSNDWSRSLREIAGLAVDIICKFPLSALKQNPNVLPDDRRDLIVKVSRQEVPVSGWNYNCPEPQSDDFKHGSVSFDSASCPALNSTMQFVYEPADTANPPTPCSAAAPCAAGQRCGNCGYCERP